MRKTLTLVLLLAPLPFAGCATAHDYCVSHADNYSSYDECYSERIARSEQIRHSLSRIGDRGSYQAQTIQPPQYTQPVNCTTNTYSGTAYTSCY